MKRTIIERTTRLLANSGEAIKRYYVPIEAETARKRYCKYVDDGIGNKNVTERRDCHGPHNLRALPPETGCKWPRA